MGSMGTMGSVGMMEADMLNLKMNEKELLNGLNNRFAAYIEKGRPTVCRYDPLLYVAAMHYRCIIYLYMSQICIIDPLYVDDLLLYFPFKDRRRSSFDQI